MLWAQFYMEAVVELCHATALNSHVLRFTARVLSGFLQEDTSVLLLLLLTAPRVFAGPLTFNHLRYYIVSRIAVAAASVRAGALGKDRAPLLGNLISVDRCPRSLGINIPKS